MNKKIKQSYLDWTYRENFIGNISNAFLNIDKLFLTDGRMKTWFFKAEPQPENVPDKSC